MKRLLRPFHHGEKGFTLIELLVIIAVLGILAVVVVPNVASFLGAGTVAAANTEAANVETAAMAYYAEHNGTWPSDSNDLSGYLSGELKASYDFDTYGKISDATDISWGGITWSDNLSQWTKI